MITEKIYLDVLTDEYKEAALELVNRMNWKVKSYGRMIEIMFPERDTAIFDFVFGAI